ncbi:MAG: hypothetical protein HZA11_13580 [Nitrospirae bacterium]|nr:hypothetical protein [Nitrospirota bacterium]
MITAAEDEPRKKLYDEYVLKSKLYAIRYAYQMGLIEMPEVVRLLQRIFIYEAEAVEMFKNKGRIENE